MNNSIDLSENKFLVPYYKQFLRILKKDKILLLENIKTNAESYFLGQGKTITSNINDTNVSGIIINDYLSDKNEEELPAIINNLYNILDSDGIILLINNSSKIDSTLISYLFKNKFEIIEELIGDNKWNFILYQKRTTK